MELAKTIDELRRQKHRLCQSASAEKPHRPIVGFVPTMGNLHQGHVSLMEKMRDETDVRITSIFVNPTQFGPAEDFARYPRTLDEDLARCEKSGVDLAFVPEVSDMYRADAATTVSVHRITERFCGAARPGHFDGVALVVSKLFNIVQPDIAYFGQKDYQQFRVIEKMASDLDFPVRLVMCPTVREEDGLAMSSRNGYLSPDQRKAAASLYAGLKALEEAFRAGEASANKLKSLAQSRLDEALVLEYLDIANAQSLEPIETATEGSVVLIAARVGTTRLIDNIILGNGGLNVH